MPLLPPPTDQASVPLETRKARTAQRLEMALAQSYRDSVRVQKDGIAQVWKNPLGLTPQEVFYSVGTNAGAMLAAHGALTTCIIIAATAAGVAPDIALPTHAFTVNEDGTVTVLEGPYVP